MWLQKSCTLNLPIGQYKPLLDVNFIKLVCDIWQLQDFMSIKYTKNNFNTEGCK